MMKDNTGIEERKLLTEEVLGRKLNDVERRYSPREVYISGSMSVPVPGPRVAIVGTRNPSVEGRSAARQIASELSAMRVVVISGLARGIDTEAHRAAINARGRTIAVLGTPLDHFYPPENRDLQTELMKKHLVVSQFAREHPVLRKNFVIRNRTMALFSDASIIVEAGDSSGTLSQGWETLRLGRPLFILDSVFKDKNLKWPEEMIGYGAIRLSKIRKVFEFIPSGNFAPEIPRP